jgi:hypothetical protein
MSGVGEIPSDLRPTLALLTKLGSIARHVEEGTGPVASPLDLQAASTLAADPEVQSWLAAADRYALLPVPRS